MNLLKLKSGDIIRRERPNMLSVVSLVIYVNLKEETVVVSDRSTPVRFSRIEKIYTKEDYPEYFL